MHKLSMSAAWDDAMVLLRSHLPLTSTLAAVFFFLPALAVVWFSDPPPTVAEDASLAAVMAQLQAQMRGAVVPTILTSIASLIGTVAIMRLWLSRGSTSVGEAIGYTLSLLPTLIILLIIEGLAIGIGMVLLIIPGIYIACRLVTTNAVVADMGLRNPIDVLRASWDMTRDNAGAIFVFILLITLAALVILFLTGMVTGILGDAGSPGFLIGSAIEAAVGAAFSLVSAAVTTAIYRQLAPRAETSIFE